MTLIVESFTLANAPDHIYQRSNLNQKLLGQPSTVRNMFLKHARGRKLTELMTDHVLGTKNGRERLSLCTKRCGQHKPASPYRESRPVLSVSCAELFILSISPEDANSTKGVLLLNDLAIKSRENVRPKVRSKATSHFSRFFIRFFLSKIKRSLGYVIRV